MTPAGGKLVMLDSFGLIYRAYFALPPLSGPGGEPTNAVLGFTTMLMRIIAEENPEYLIAAFDRGLPQARMELYPQYKAHRDEMPDDLRSQIPLVRKVLETFDIPILEQEGEEADDVLASLAAQAEAAHDVRIITGDLDLLQIVDDRTTVVVTKRGIGELLHYTPAAVRERYGLDPMQLPDYRGLKGDPSDNLPGVPGIGEKTAIKLIAAAGSLDELLAHPEKAGTAKLQQLLIDHAEAARICRDVSVANRKLDVQLVWDDALYRAPSTAKLAALYRELGFKQLLAKLDLSGADDDAPESDAPAPVNGEYRVYGGTGDDAVEEKNELLAELARLRTLPKIAVAHGEHAIGLCWQEGAALALEGPALLDEDIRGELVALLNGVEHLTVHDGKALFAALRPVRMRRAAPAVAPPGARRKKTPAAGQVGLFDVAPAAEDVGDAQTAPRELPVRPRALCDDTMLAAYVLNTSHAYHGVAEAAQAVLGLPVSSGIAAAADAVWRTAEKARAELTERGQLALYAEIELPTATVLAEMEAAGVALDLAELERLAVDIDADVERKQRDIYALAGEEFNLGSPQQLGRILFDKLGLPGGKRNKTGYATGVEVLAALAQEFEIAALVLAYREVAKLKNTYVDVLPGLVDADGRLRTVFHQTTTATGRLSSTNPNLQNIPVRGDLGRRIRKAFVAGPGRVLLAADYSQIELRLMAHLSGDEAMRAAFRAGHDIHDETARRIFAVPAGFDVDREQRRLAKSVNFGLLYGMGEFGLAQRLGIARDEARRLVETYFGQFPGVRGYLDGTVAFGREHGYVQTLAGRRRYLPDLRSRDHFARAAAEREATNAPLQGGAADLVKIAMVRVARALRDADAPLLLQIHDELIFEVAEADLRQVAAAVRREMSGAMELSVPLEVSVKTGKTWFEVAAYADDDAGASPDETAVFS